MKCTCGDLTALGVVHRTDGPCYIPEPQRQWAGLDNDALIYIYSHADKSVGKAIELTEAKLKEKNT